MYNTPFGCPSAHTSALSLPLLFVATGQVPTNTYGCWGPLPNVSPRVRVERYLQIVDSVSFAALSVYLGLFRFCGWVDHGG
jgi:hypothetical protein